MPKKVSEITAGQSNERSQEGGSQVDVSVRSWRVVLSSPAETYDIQKEIRVYIGDPHPVNTGIPCVSISERAEGDSRVVRIVTATYRATPGSDPQGGGDPNLIEPELRPANWSVSSSLMEVPVGKSRNLGAGGTGGNPMQAALKPFTNPVGDLYEGITKLVPIINVRVEQFEPFNIALLANLRRVGNINSDQFLFVGQVVTRFSCMFRSLEIRPHIEAWRNEPPRRGYMMAYEFSIRTDESGWNHLVPIAGFNIKNQGLGQPDVETGALSLELTDGGRIKGWPNPELAVGTQGKKMRANVLIAGIDGGASQRPSAQPVPLNRDGTPRNTLWSQNEPVLIDTHVVQDAIDFQENFAAFNCRIRG